MNSLKHRLYCNNSIVPNTMHTMSQFHFPVNDNTERLVFALTEDVCFYIVCSFKRRNAQPCTHFLLQRNNNFSRASGMEGGKSKKNVLPYIMYCMHSPSQITCHRNGWRKYVVTQKLLTRLRNRKIR